MRALLTFISTALVISFVFIAMPHNANAQPGCCRTVDEAPTTPAGECVPCEGQACLTTEEFCETESGFFNTGRICVTTPNGANCNVDRPILGCCVIEQAECIDDASERECFNNEDGQVFVRAVECSEVDLCDPLPVIPKNVPTLSEMGLIVMAGILGVIGFIMVIRRKATA